MALTTTENNSTIHLSPWHCDESKFFAGNVANLIASSPKILANPDKKLLIDALNPDTNYLTARTLLESTRKAAYVLKHKYGVQENDVVCLLMFNSIYVPVAHHSILSLGAVVSPANVVYLPNELHHQLNVSKAKLIIADPTLLPTANKATSEFTPVNVQNIITIDQLIEDIKSAPESDQIAPMYISPEDAKTKHAYYCFSSGTSGHAKGVMSTHYNMSSNVQQLEIVSNSIYSQMSLFGATLPMSHIFGLSSFVYCLPYGGFPAVVFRQFNFELILQKIVELEINFFHVVPPMAVLFAKSPLVDKYPLVKKHIKCFVCGAAPLSNSLAKAVSERLDCVIRQAYGLTETSPVTHFFSYDTTTYDVAGVGWLVPGMQAKLVEEDGSDVHGFNTPGELWMRGPNVMMGYLHNPEATAHAFSDESLVWFKTGDVAVIKPDGQYLIVDRFKELIKSKGHQVAPAELEAIMLTHPGIADSAVIGYHVPDEGTELPRAFVVLRDNKQDPLEIKKWFDGQVARHKRLWGGIVVLDEIPKSPAGKILRRLLRSRKDDVAIGYPVKSSRL